MRVPAHTAQAGREGGSGGWLQHGVSLHRPDGVPGTAAGGVYEVCSVIARRDTGCGVVDQVVRLDRLLRHPQEPPFPALGGLGWLVGDEQVFRPSCWIRGCIWLIVFREYVFDLV